MSTNLHARAKFPKHNYFTPNRLYKVFNMDLHGLFNVITDQGEEALCAAPPALCAYLARGCWEFVNVPEQTVMDETTHETTISDIESILGHRIKIVGE